jgi:hypothetical protein
MFTLERLIKVRPFLYHLTARANLAQIQLNRRLDSAATLLRAHGKDEWLCRRRLSHLTIPIGGGALLQIRDQQPLHPGNVDLHGAWSFEDLVGHLNEHVFFWPGTAEGPIDYGHRHLARYQSENPVLLRVPVAELLSANPGVPPLLCAFNSGAPRCSGGRRSPRGPSLFQDARAYKGSPGSVVEVTIHGSIALPLSTQVVETNNTHDLGRRVR